MEHARDKIYFRLIDGGCGLSSQKPDAMATLQRDIRDSGFFDQEFYLRQNPDVVQAGIDPLEHYVRYGAAEGREPAPWFDTQCYLREQPHIEGKGINPFHHYILMASMAEGIKISGLFDVQFYLRQNPDVAEAGVDPVMHYVLHGVREGRQPALWFDTQAYLRLHPRFAATGLNPFYLYILIAAMTDTLRPLCRTEGERKQDDAD